VLLACTATIGTVPLMYCMSRRYLYILDDALTTYTADESGLGEGKPPVPPCILRVGKATQAALEVDDRGKRALVLKVTADFVRVQVRAGGEGLGEGTVGAATCNGVWGAGEGAGWVAVTQTQTGGLVSRADGFPGVPPTPCPSFHSWLQIKAGINSGHANEELLEMLRGVLGVRLGQLSLKRGEDTRHKVLLVEGMSPEAVYTRLQTAVNRNPRSLGRSSKHVINTSIVPMDAQEPAAAAPAAAQPAQQGQQPQA
jgi:hypothetical protein